MQQIRKRSYYLFCKALTNDLFCHLGWMTCWVNSSHLKTWKTNRSKHSQENGCIHSCIASLTHKWTYWQSSTPCPPGAPQTNIKYWVLQPLFCLFFVKSLPELPWEQNNYQSHFYTPGNKLNRQQMGQTIQSSFQARTWPLQRWLLSASSRQPKIDACAS